MGIPFSRIASQARLLSMRQPSLSWTWQGTDASFVGTVEECFQELCTHGHGSVRAYKHSNLRGLAAIYTLPESTI